MRDAGSSKQTNIYTTRINNEPWCIQAVIDDHELWQTELYTIRFLIDSSQDVVKITQDLII